MGENLAITLIMWSPAVIVLIVVGFRHLGYSQRQRTIRLALEKGVDPSPLLAEEAAEPLQPRKYLLRGLLWGLPGLVIGGGVSWSAIRHGMPPTLSWVGWIPAAIGAAYLIFYRLDRAQSSGTGDSSHPASSLVLPPRAVE